MGMAVKLYRCSGTWIKGPHPCWKVEKALIDMGVEYTPVLGPLRRGKRTELQAKTGQSRYPAIELEDGTIYRAESKDMAARIRAGELVSNPPAPPSAPA